MNPFLKLYQELEQLVDEAEKADTAQLWFWPDLRAAYGEPSSIEDVDTDFRPIFLDGIDDLDLGPVRRSEGILERNETLQGGENGRCEERGGRSSGRD